MGPRITSISRLVYPKAGFRIRRGIRLSGPCIEGVGRRVIGEGADRIRGEAARDKGPGWMQRDPVTTAPDAAARGSHPHSATMLATVGRDSQRRDPAGRGI